ncbi:MAG TPA: T9SS type A sorting domain-containing protein [Sphingobacteriaceae bacterium]|nr:T9SS type A sorting domain-containing protein [Sphingobacteriaceae bacterium]
MLMFLTGIIGGVNAQHNAGWPFYIAFEDAIGERDTIWMVMDQDATLNADTFLNEVPIVLDTDSFNVWIMYMTDGQHPYEVFAVPLYGNVDALVFAENYVLPLTASWDTSLFQAEILHEVLGYGVNDARLENEYMPLETGFNMLETDHVEMPWFPWGSQSHFPLFVYISCGPTDDVPTDDVDRSRLKLYPNPVGDRLYMKSDVPASSYVIYDISGRLVEYRGANRFATGETEIVLPPVHSGMYFLKVTFPDGTVALEKFVRD